MDHWKYFVLRIVAMVAMGTTGHAIARGNWKLAAWAGALGVFAYLELLWQAAYDAATRTGGEHP